MNIKIVTDTGCDISEEVIKKYDIEILNMPVNDGEEEFLTRGDLSSAQMFANMREGKIYRTSQVNDIDYRNCFEKYAKEGREIIYIALSSGITSSYNGACKIRDEIIEKYKDAKIHVFDSFCATGGLALMVHRAAMMAYDGRDESYIIKELEKLKQSQEHIFSVTNLEFLVRGGRLSRTAATIGGILNIKPILEIDKSEGKLVAFDKARGEKNLYKKILQEIEKKSKGNFDKNQTIAIGYGDDMSHAKILADSLVEHYDIDEKNISFIQLGSVVGAHTGPDFIALYFLSETIENYSIVK